MPAIPLHIYFLLASVLASLLFYSQYRPLFPEYLKFFFPFLLIILLVEVTAIYMSGLAHPNTRIMYNYSSVFEFCFYFFIISEMIENRKIKKYIYYALVIYPIVALTNIVFIQSKDSFHSTTYAVGCLAVVFCCILYFSELFKRVQSVRLINEPAFWICSGLLFFYCCSFPMFGLSNILMKLPVFMLQGLAIIIKLLNIFLYTLFTIAFVCRIKIGKYTLS